VLRRTVIVNSPSHSIPFFIRVAYQPDLPDLTEVLAHSFHSQDGLVGWLYPLFKMGIYEDLRSRLSAKTPHYACLVAVKRLNSLDCKRSLYIQAEAFPLAVGRIAGTVEVGLRGQLPWQKTNQQYFYISNLAVQKNYRRQGIAFQLLQACEQMAFDWGHRELYLHVLENNHAARQLYQKAGYQIKAVESSLGSCLMGQPKQLLLKKSLGARIK